MNSWRDYHLSFCKQCKNRKFNPQKGIVCSLTDEYADFDKNCEHFIVDPVAKSRYESDLQKKEKYHTEQETLGLSKIGIKNGIVAGAIVSILGLSWLLAGLIVIEHLSVYALLVIIAGITTLVSGIIKRNKNKKKKILEHPVIDNDFEA